MTLADIGPGWVALLSPVLNLVVIALVYKITGKNKADLEGTVEGAKSEIQHDLKNGISEKLAGIHTRLDHEIVPRLDRKKRAIQELREDVTQLDGTVHSINEHLKKDQAA